jgi:S1-C subfamily serine protease
VLRLIPDWLLYIVVIAVVVFVLFKVDQRSNAPEALPDATQNGAFLPPPSVYDPEILVEVGPQSSGLGSAFAVTADGWWVTARHVVDACSRVGIIVSRGAAAPVRQVRVAQFADLALLKTDRAPSPLAIATVERNLQVGQRAFHVGFPQGHPGEAYSRLIGRENLIARGRYDVDEPVLTWAELGRTSGMSGSLAGMSGGPAFDANGEVIGVTIAESARRGRLYTASPATILRMLRVEQIHAQGTPAPHFTTENYGNESDALRRALAVAQVVCVTDDTPS